MAVSMCAYPHTTRNIKSVLSGAGIPYEAVDVSASEITISQTGQERRLPEIAGVLAGAGLFFPNPGTASDQVQDGTTTITRLKRL